VLDKYIQSFLHLICYFTYSLSTNHPICEFSSDLYANIKQPLSRPDEDIQSFLFCLHFAFKSSFDFLLLDLNIIFSINYSD